MTRFWTAYQFQIFSESCENSVNKLCRWRLPRRGWGLGRLFALLLVLLLLLLVLPALAFGTAARAGSLALFRARLLLLVGLEQRLG